MMMELTFDAAGGAPPGSLRAPTLTTRDSVSRHARAPQPPAPERPAGDAPEIGQRNVSAEGWHGAHRLLRRTEEAFAVVVLACLLALGTLTFGYAFDGLAAAQAAGLPAVAVSD